jgi:hypothetical protein
MSGLSLVSSGERLKEVALAVELVRGRFDGGSGAIVWRHNGNEVVEGGANERRLPAGQNKLVGGITGPTSERCAGLGLAIVAAEAPQWTARYARVGVRMINVDPGSVIASYTSDLTQSALFRLHSKQATKPLDPGLASTITFAGNGYASVRPEGTLCKTDEKEAKAKPDFHTRDEWGRLGGVRRGT